MAYIPNPADSSQPLDNVDASTAAAEFRALKSYIAAFTGGSGALNLFRKNFLHNATMTVWPEGAGPFTITAGSSRYTAEGLIITAAGASLSVSRVTSTAGRSKYAVQITGNSGNTGAVARFRLPGEQSDLMGLVTFSCMIYNNTGAVINPTFKVFTPTVLNDFTTTNERYSEVVQSCPVGAWTRISTSVDVSAFTDIDKGIQVQVNLGAIDSGTKTILTTEWQLEAGGTATELEWIHPLIERILCEFYYEVGGWPDSGFHGDVTTGNTYLAFVLFRVRKHTTPTVTLTNVTNAGFPATVGSVGGPVATGYYEARVANATAAGGQFITNYVADARL